MPHQADEWPQDQGPRGKVVDYRVPNEMSGTRVAPGDIVFGDLDGVCVVPRAAEQELFRGAFEKARGEKTVRQALERGMAAREAFEKIREIRHSVADELVPAHQFLLFDFRLVEFDSVARAGGKREMGLRGHWRVLLEVVVRSH